MYSTVLLGAENFLKSPPHWLRTAKLGVLCSQASCLSDYSHFLDHVAALAGKNLVKIFSPQHGFFAEKQDNMVESSDTIHPHYRVPVISLYSHRRKPTADDFDHIDVLLIDIQDVGTRVYTFFSTVAYCLEVAAEKGIKVVVLDRPNPVNGIDLEGHRLLPGFESFVGRYPIPMRHGLTLAEFCLYLRSSFLANPLDLEIVKMTGWYRSMLFHETGLPWVMPSPNLPTIEGCYLYPGQVILEGTTLSEGRGTTRPFEVFGAPYIDPWKLLSRLKEREIPGVCFRPFYFQPTFNKYAGETCGGLFIHILDAKAIKPVAMSLHIIDCVSALYSEFDWQKKPYEYEFDVLAIDLILGSDTFRLNIGRDHALENYLTASSTDVECYKKETHQNFECY